MLAAGGVLPDRPGCAVDAEDSSSGGGAAGRVLRERAKSMEQTLDQGFVERNCALPTRTALPEPCSAFGAQLLRQLGINEEV